MKQKWYDKKWLVIFLLVVFYPVGVYALWKNGSFSFIVKILLTIVLLIFILVISVYGPEDTSYRDKERALSVLKSYYHIIQPNERTDGRVGERVSYYEYALRSTAHIPEKYHYGWEIRKNPIGEGILVGYGTWAMTIDSTKQMRVIWLIDKNNVKAANVITCCLMDEYILSNETLEIYENAFK